MTDSELNKNYLKTLIVLYVEDDIDVREQLSQYLRRRVGVLLIAKNGSEGLEIYRKEQPDMIITDILMPVMDGLEMAAEIRKTDFNTPIIVTTAFESSSYFMRSIDIGVDKYVTKPIDTASLDNAMQKCANRLKINEQLRLAYKVFDNSMEAILITDANNNIYWTNPAFTNITGYSNEEVIGKNPRLLSSSKQDATFYEAVWTELSTKGYWKGEIWNKRKNGEIYPEWLSINLLLDARGKVTHHVGIFSDISDHKAAEDKIKYLATHDPLTGLPNRNLLSDRMKVALAHADRKQEQVALMMLDLDNFKRVNDTYGHKIGDMLLIEVAKLLVGMFRASDTICRLGGDEFVIVLNDIADMTYTCRAAGNILKTITPELAIEDHAMGISPSIGIARYPKDGMDLDTLLKNADIAMYSAKHNGGNTFHFFSEDTN